LPRPSPAARPSVLPSLGSLIAGSFWTAPGNRPGLSPRPAALTQTQALRVPSDPTRCNCSTTKPKRKPKKPRDVCYRGTFVETRSGLAKVRKEKIPCR
jgi:hypothetical protein